jgi:hypothetical protein
VKTVLFVVVVLLGTSSHAQGQVQVVAASLEELRELLRPGRTVTVTDAGGLTTRGTVASVTADTLVLDTESVQASVQKMFGSGPLRAFTERPRQGV